MASQFRVPAAHFVAWALVLPGALHVTASTQPTFRSTTHLVTLDVVATDRNGMPVTDLRQSELRVVERGRSQQVETFELIRIPVGGRTLSPDAATYPPADVGTNATSPSENRAIAIVVDDTMLSTGDIVRIKRTLTALIEAISPNDDVALTYVRDSSLGQDFTRDTGKLARAINRVNAALGLPGLAVGEMEARDLLTVLQNVATTLRGASQSRRIIVLVGIRGCLPHAVGMSNRRIMEVCKDVIREAHESGVTIYGLDPTGDLTDGHAAGSTIGSLSTLAAATGGRTYRYAQPELAAQRLMRDNGSYYVLSYRPSPLRDDGRFQEVHVTTTRPGVEVRARRGYMAPSGQIARTSAQTATDAALAAGLTNPGLPIRMFVAPIHAGRSSKVPTLVTAEVRYPVPAEARGRPFKDVWTLGMVAVDADGHIKAARQRSIEFDGNWTSSASGVVLLNDSIELPPGTLTVRLAVSSRTLSATGSAHLEVDVDKVNSRQLFISGLVLAGHDQPLPDAAIGLDHIRHLVPFQPLTGRQFAAGEALRVFARAFWGGSEESPSASVAVVWPGGSSELWKGRLLAESVDSTTGSQAGLLDRQVTLPVIPRGPAILVFSASLPNERAVVKKVPIEIR